MNENKNQTSQYNLSQLMITAAAREIADGEVVFVGMRLPLLGFLLAKSTHAPDAIGVYELGIVRDAVAPEPILTMGDLPNLNRAQWLADTADAMGLLQKGGVDVSFIGGAQVDRYGNLNTSYIGGADDVGIGLPPRPVRYQAGEGQKIRCLGQQHVVLQEKRHADGADQGGKARRFAQWFVGNLFKGPAVAGRVDHRCQRGQDQDGECGPPQH